MRSDARGVVGVRTMHMLRFPHAFTSQYCIVTSLVSTFCAILLLSYVRFFSILGACDQHTTKCHLHMGISPGDRGVTSCLTRHTLCSHPYHRQNCNYAATFSTKSLALFCPAGLMLKCLWRSLIIHYEKTCAYPGILCECLDAQVFYKYLVIL